jgi:Spy/CpxP family protein refolding chaperone
MKVTLAVRLGLTIAALLTAGTMAQAQAQTPPGGPEGGFGGHRPPMERALGPQGEHGRWWNNPAMVEKLKLTDTQRKQMDDILQEHREGLVDLRGTLEKAELALEPLMKADQPDETKILAQIDQVAQARAELEKANARFLLALRSKLTPEQWKQVQEDRASRPQMRRGWGAAGRGQGGQAPPPPGGPQGLIDAGPGAGVSGAGGIQ